MVVARALLVVSFLGAAFLWLLPVTPAAAPLAPAAPKRASSAIAITIDGARLLAVNPDSNSVSLVDLQPAVTVNEIAVGVDPRTLAVDDAGHFAYVANRGSDSVTKIDLSLGEVVAQIPTGRQPYGVVISPDGLTLYVAEQGQRRINVIDTAAQTSVGSYAVPDRPSGLALTDDGRFLIVTHLLLNQLTVIDLLAQTIYLPLVANNNSSVEQAALSGDAPPAVMSGLQTTIPLFPNSNLLQSVVLAPGGVTAVLPHTRSNSGNSALTFDSTVFPIASFVDIQAGLHLVGQQFDLAALDPPAVGLPFDAAFTPDGAELWLANAASNDLTVIDTATRQLAAHVPVGHNPRGIVMAPDGAAAYVNNALAGTISVIDTAAYTVTAVITISAIPLDPTVLLGKRLFFSSADSRMGRDQWISCSSCHFDGEHDGRTWQLGFAGPRNTTSMLGLSQTPPWRWSGEWDELADAEFAIRMDNFGSGLVPGPMNCSIDPPDCVNHPPHAGTSADLDALAAYLGTLTMPLSPYPFDAAAQQGQIVFESLGCAQCHPAPLYTDNSLHDVGTMSAGEKIGPVFNTPSLRGLHGSWPYFHDGSAATLAASLARPSPNGEHHAASQLSEEGLSNLIAFLLALPYE